MLLNFLLYTTDKLQESQNIDTKPAEEQKINPNNPIEVFNAILQHLRDSQNKGTIDADLAFRLKLNVGPPGEEKTTVLSAGNTGDDETNKEPNPPR